MAYKERPASYLSSSQISKRKTKAGLLWRPFSQHKRQVLCHFGFALNRTIFEEGSSVTKIHSARYGKECIFCLRWTSFSKDFSAYANQMTNDLVSYMLRKWPPKKAGAVYLSSSQISRRGKPKAGLLWQPFSQHRDKVIGHIGFQSEKSLRREVHLWQKIHSARYGKRMYFCHRWTSFSKDFSAYTNQMTNDLSLMLRKWPPRRPAFSLPLFSQISREENQRPAAFGGHFFCIRTRVIGQSLFYKQKILWERQVHLWQ